MHEGNGLLRLDDMKSLVGSPLTANLGEDIPLPAQMKVCNTSSYIPAFSFLFSVPQFFLV